MEQLLALQTLQSKMPPKTAEAHAAMEKHRHEIPTPILAHYERLVLRGKKGVAIARNGVCSECHLRIPSGTLAALAYDNEVHLCDNCGRFLYLPEDEPLGLGDPKALVDPPPAPARQASRPRPAHAR